MEYRQHIEEALSYLEETNDSRLDVMILLTKAKWSTYQKDYDKMWQSLFTIESDYCKSKNNDWVFSFLDDVIEFKEEKPYYDMSGQKRTALIKKIKKKTDALKALYIDSGLDVRLVGNEGQFFEGFDAYDEDGNIISENGNKVLISDALEFFFSHTENEILETAVEGKIAESHKAHRFIRLLVRRNKSRYDTPLNSIVIAATYAIYKEKYDEADISKLLKRIKKKAQ